MTRPRIPRSELSPLQRILQDVVVACFIAVVLSCTVAVVRSLLL